MHPLQRTTATLQNTDEFEYRLRIRYSPIKVRLCSLLHLHNTKYIRTYKYLY
jgi:hypothetical protein